MTNSQQLQWFTRAAETLELHAALTLFKPFLQSHSSEIRLFLDRPLGKQEWKDRHQLQYIFEPLVTRDKLPVINRLLNLDNLRNSIHKSTIPDTDFYLQLRHGLKLSRSLGNILDQAKEAQRFILPDSLNDYLQLLQSWLTDEGDFTAEASPRLVELVHLYEKEKKRIQNTLRDVLQRWSKYLQDTIITQREGRYVLAVKAEHQHAAKGQIIDSSSSGQTVFIEPLAVAHHQKIIMQAEREMEQEMQRLLTELALLAQQNRKEILFLHFQLYEADLAQAAVRYMHHYKGIFPKWSAQQQPKLIRACHPILLEQANSGQIPKAVPFDFIPRKGTKTVIITGSNTGGKTSILKAVGVLHLQALLALPVTASDGSEFIRPKRLFADIGDNQSIASSLSTFAAHLTHIREFLTDLPSPSLVLLDELGTGTDPMEGSALGQAILLYLQQQHHNFTICTTHLQALAELGLGQKHMLNASVSFDVNTFSPTYQFLMGVPGRSHALDVAQKLELPQEILDQARNLYHPDRKVESMVEALTAEHQVIRHLKDEAQSHELNTALKEKELTKVITDYQQKILEVRKKALMEIRMELTKIKQRVRHLPSKGQAMEQVRAGEKKLEKIVNDKLTPDDEMRKKSNKPLEIDGWAQHSSLGIEGKIIDINNQKNEIKLDIYGKEMIFPLKDIWAIDKKEEEEKDIISQQPTIITPSASYTGGEIVLVGMRAEQALTELEKFIDNAVLDNREDIRIIHGRGTGRLKKMVHQTLRLHHLITTFSLENKDDGAITIATMVKY